jgi:flagella basal body P-ring formation protein FlgA
MDALRPLLLLLALGGGERDRPAGAPATPTVDPMAPPAAPAKQLLVVLKPAAAVRHTPVVLADVADLSGPGELVARAQSLQLGPAPAGGQPRKITPAGVLLAARLAGLELDRGRIVGAPDVLVSASWHELAPDRLIDVAEKHLLKETAQLGDRVVVERSLHPDAVALLDGGDEPTFACSLVGRAQSGMAQVKVSVFQAASLVGERVVTLKVRRFGHQLRLLTDVRAGNVIAPEQVIVIDGEWTNVAGVPLVALAELAGSVAKRDLAAGTVLVKDAFESPLLVERGGTVLCVLQEGGLQIVLTGVAERSGRRGDAIPVTNPTTQKVLQVELIGKRPTGEAFARIR